MKSAKFHLWPGDKEARAKAERKKVGCAEDPPLSRRRILVKWMEAEKPGGGANPYNPVSNPSSSRPLTGHLPRSLSFCPFVARADRRDSSHRQIGGAVSFQDRTFPCDRTAALLRPLVQPLVFFLLFNSSCFPSYKYSRGTVIMHGITIFSKFKQVDNGTL